MAFSVMFIPEVIFQSPSAVTLGRDPRGNPPSHRASTRPSEAPPGSPQCWEGTHRRLDLCLDSPGAGGSPGLAMNDMERKEPLIWNLYNYIDYNAFITITNSLIYVVPT